jgi:predicted NAD/FAD-binding protein
MRRVAVVGAGISGLGVARALSRHARVTVFEAETRLGGHAHTVDVELDGIRHGVDIGFLVYNERTYPNLIRLFGELGVETAASDMSFSVQSPATGWEWCGSDLNTVFAQRTNLVSSRFWRMLLDIVRFNRETTAMAQRGEDAELDEPIGDYLTRRRFSAAFRDGYFLPMLGCIWSCPTDQMLRFPVGTMVRFCHNHGLLQLTERPQWRTVRGGSANYVRRIAEGLADVRTGLPVRQVRRLPAGAGQVGVTVHTDQGSERFDDVVLACHTDQALTLLGDATPAERSVLGSIAYQRNRIVLHSDATMLPRRPLAWAAWNYERAGERSTEQAAVCLHYLINRLQPLPWARPVIVSMNPVRAVQPTSIVGEWEVDHPVFDRAAVKAQRELPSIQGRSRVWFCGAWSRYGFHEDGLGSGLAVADALREYWAVQDREGAAA